MLTEICQYLKNWFVKSDKDKHFGIFKISEGVITPSFYLQPNQYYRIIGSLYNDGVHQFGNAEDKLTDETFDGAIWIMYVPPQIISLSKEITEWIKNNDKVQKSIYKSESFGGYSYSIKSGKNSDILTWRDVFYEDLKPWRKIR